METKQIIILRKDLKLSKEKMVEQGIHASMASVLNLGVRQFPQDGQNKRFFCIPLSETLKAWLSNKAKTTTVSISANSEDELLSLAEKAKNDGLIHALIQDAGLTEFGGIPTYTSLGIGSDLVILRKDLNMRKGKMIAQSSHASMAVVLNQGSLREFNQAPDDNEELLYIPLNAPLEAWLTGKFKKIALSVNSEAELFALAEKAKEVGLIHALVQDEKQVYTALAIGPDIPEKIDPLTGSLSLL
jgi:PTH2 family peptidyl-tRNA hydrolase